MEAGPDDPLIPLNQAPKPLPNQALTAVPHLHSQPSAFATIHEIQDEDGKFVNTEELLNSDDEYYHNNVTNDSESEEGSDNEGEQLFIEEERLKCPHCDSTFR